MPGGLETVAAVEAAAAAAIRDLKRQFSNRFRLAISAAADRQIKQVRAGNRDGIAFGLQVDRLLLLGGEATEHVETVEDPAAVAFRQGMAALAGHAAVTGAPEMG